MNFVSNGRRVYSVPFFKINWTIFNGITTTTRTNKFCENIFQGSLVYSQKSCLKGIIKHISNRSPVWWDAFLIIALLLSHLRSNFLVKINILVNILKNSCKNLHELLFTRIRSNMLNAHKIFQTFWRILLFT